MAKPSRSAAELQQLIRARLDRTPEIEGLSPQLMEATVVGKDRGLNGPNWTVRSARNPESYCVALAHAIRQLQMEYDLEGD